MESSIVPNIDKVISQNQLNNSKKAFLSILLHCLSHVLYGILLFWIIQDSSNIMNWNEPKIYLFFFSIILLFLTLVFSQHVFNVNPNKKILSKLTSKKENLKHIAGFYNITGFKKFYRYIFPFIFYLLYFTFFLLLILPLIFYVPGQFFNHSSNDILSIIFVLTIFAPVGIGILIYSYIAQSSFIEMYSDIIVIRKGLKTYYIPVKILEEIGYYTKYGRLRTITYKIKNSQIIRFQLNYLKNKAKEIPKVLDSQYNVKTKKGNIMRTLYR